MSNQHQFFKSLFCILITSEVDPCILHLNFFTSFYTATLPYYHFLNNFYASKQLEYGFKIIIENNKHIEQDKENVTHLFTQMCYIFMLNNSTTLSFSHFFIFKMYHLRTTCCSLSIIID